MIGTLECAGALPVYVGSVVLRQKEKVDGGWWRMTAVGVDGNGKVWW